METQPHIRREKTGRLFTTFLRIGAFTFGGGYAMIPLIEREVVEEHKWATHEEIMDIIGIAEATPGVIAVNAATFIGYRMAGFWGSVAATCGVVLPSLVVIGCVALVFEWFQSLTWVMHAFEGIRAGVMVLMANAVAKFSRHLRATWFNMVVGCAAFGATAFTSVGAVWVILAALAAGLLADAAGRGRRRRGDA